MQPNHFDHFATQIKNLTQLELQDSQRLRSLLRIASAGQIEVCYTPMEHVNPSAKVVIVGITPGMTQLTNSVAELQRQLIRGSNREMALRAAKNTGAFSGAMRPNLIKLLDAVGLNVTLGIRSCASLFAEDSGLVQTTSVLRNAVFLRGGNYNGSPNMTKTPLLREQLLSHFADDARHWHDAVFVPLGDKSAEALRYLADHGHLARSRVLVGLPHPSGANAERIAYFLGTKDKQSLSAKTDPDRLDRVRAQLKEQARVLRLSA